MVEPQPSKLVVRVRFPSPATRDKPWKRGFSRSGGDLWRLWETALGNAIGNRSWVGARAECAMCGHYEWVALGPDQTEFALLPLGKALNGRQRRSRRTGLLDADHWRGLLAPSPSGPESDVVDEPHRNRCFPCATRTGHRWERSDREVFPTGTSHPLKSAVDDGHHIKFHASGNNVKMKWIKDKDEDVGKFVATVRGRMKGGSPAASASPAAGVAAEPPSIPDQIRKLGALRDEGQLTDDGSRGRGPNCSTKCNSRLSV